MASLRAARLSVRAQPTRPGAALDLLPHTPGPGSELPGRLQRANLSANQQPGAQGRGKHGARRHQAILIFLLPRVLLYFKRSGSWATRDHDERRCAHKGRSYSSSVISIIHHPPSLRNTPRSPLSTTASALALALALALAFAFAFAFLYHRSFDFTAGHEVYYCGCSHLTGLRWFF